jgi:HNH endonuclease
MAQCNICGSEIAFLDRVKAPQLTRCKICSGKLHEAHQYWMNIIERAFLSEGVSPQLEQEVYRNFQVLRMPPDLGQSVIHRLHYLRNLSEIRWGHVPIIHAGIHIDSDEVAHFSLSTAYHKQNKQIRFVPGHLIGTNKKMYFISQTGKDSMTLDWNNVVRVDAYPYSPQFQSQLIQMQVAKGAGGGYYSVPDSLYAKTIIDTLVRLWKRQLVLYKEQSTQGEIPKHIQNAVMQRDGGRCVQCGYSGEYIEFDHIIPRSKGGTNTVDNIQLLCRRCNLKKGDRI